MKVKQTWLAISLTISIILISGCTKQNTQILNEKNLEVENELLESIAAVSIIVHDHWTENDINDGKIIYVPLINKRNEIINEVHKAYIIKNLTITLTIRGLDHPYKNYSIVLFNRTYRNVSYLDINFPDNMNKGFIIYFDELKDYKQECCVAIFAEVILPNGKVLRTHEPYDFNVKPIKY